MKIICVIDNQASFQSNLYAEHGFSLLVEDNNDKILMDSGKTPLVLKHNLDLMGVESVDKFVLSHGHEDHAGGISVVPASDEKNTTFFIHPEALTPKYAVDDGESRYIGLPENVDLEELNMHLNMLTETTKISDNIWIFNHVDDYSHFETIPKYLSIKKGEKFTKDKFLDEINLVVKTDNGLVVISGCAHRGIVNILYSAREYFQDDIYGVIGGSHLVQATSQRIQKTVDELGKLGPQIIAMGHCTGFNALCKLHNEFPDNFIQLGSGVEINLK